MGKGEIMNAKVKLIELLQGQCWKEFDVSVTHLIPKNICKELADAIIEEFPQILADKVLEGDFTTGAFLGIPPISVPRGKYQVFIKAVNKNES